MTQVIDGLENIGRPSAASVTVGSFDGLHLGHQRIIQLMKDSNVAPTTLLTFEPHPQTVVRPDIPPPPQLTSREERIKLFEEIGIDRVVFAKFDKNFAALTAEEYVKQILVDCIGVRKLFVGPNHRFGKDRLGDLNLLVQMGSECRFDVFVVDPVKLGDEIISSSRIRRKLSEGDVDSARKMLGKPYFLIGTVVRGEGRGRKLGFPTANLGSIATGKLMPPPGIYSTVTEVGGKLWPSVSHIGPRPTFPGATPTIESHLIDFDDDLYGRQIRIGLISKQREIVAFEGINALIRQMEIDRHLAIEALTAVGYDFGRLEDFQA